MPKPIPLGNDRWLLRVSTGRDPITGKYRQASRTVAAKGVRAANDKLREFQNEIDDGKASASAPKVHRVVVDYIAHLEYRECSPGTITAARSKLNLYISDSVGRLRADKLTPGDLNRLYAALLERGLAPGTVHQVHRVLRAAFGLAVKQGRLHRNPVALADPPSPAADEDIVAPDPEVVRSLLAWVETKDRKLFTFLVLAATTGARTGELCALRWCDVEGGIVRIRQSAYYVPGRVGVKATKTRRSRRDLPLLPAAETALALWRWEIEQALPAGDVLPDESYIFHYPAEPMRVASPNAMNQRWQKAKAEFGVDMRKHDLRHFVATELLAEGVELPVVSEYLGHSRTSTTSDIYARAKVERVRLAASAMERVLFEMAPKSN